MKFFVYGTLKRGFGNNRLLDGAKYIGKAITPPEYTMVSLGGFPGVIHSGQTVVSGEIWEVDDPMQTLRVDRLEGHPNFYRREEVPVQTADGVENAWIYLLPDTYLKTHKQVVSGEW